VKDRIIVALDTDSTGSALSIARSLSGEVGIFKVGMELFPRGGPELVREIRSLGGKVFLDLKFHDIPNTVAGAVRSAAAMEVTFATVHASGGRAMLRAAADAARGTGVTLLAVTVLTSLDDGDLEEIGFRSTARESVLRLAEMAAVEGIGGIVCSAREVRAVREHLGTGTVLVTPGVRMPTGNTEDQKRVVTPFEAVRQGADYLVVGRPITRAQDPAAAARTFAVEMARGRAGRNTPA